MIAPYFSIICSRLPLPWLLLEWLLSPDSIEDMVDTMEATVAMVDTITSARGLLMPRL